MLCVARLPFDAPDIVLEHVALDVQVAMRDPGGERPDECMQRQEGGQPPEAWPGAFVFGLPGEGNLDGSRFGHEERRKSCGVLKIGLPELKIGLPEKSDDSPRHQAKIPGALGDRHFADGVARAIRKAPRSPAGVNAVRRLRKGTGSEIRSRASCSDELFSYAAPETYWPSTTCSIDDYICLSYEYCASLNLRRQAGDELPCREHMNCPDLQHVNVSG
jgi:hypothetical protein